MDPSEFAKGVLVMGSRAEVKAPPQGSATYCAKEKGGVEVRKTPDYFVVGESCKENRQCGCGQRVSYVARQGGEIYALLNYKRAKNDFSGGEAHEKDKDDWQNWDLKQDIRYLEEGIDDEKQAL